MPVKNPLSDAAAKLRGMKPNEIAAMLGRRKINGRPATTGNCPIAKMMHNDEGGQFLVGQKFIIRRCGKSVDKMKTPDNIASFLRTFDRSGFPDLIAPPPRVTTKDNPKPKRGKPWRSGKHKTYGPRVNHYAKDVGRLSIL